MTSPAADLTVADATSLEWQGLTGELESDRAGTAVSYRFKSPGLTFAEPARQVTLHFGAFDLHGTGQAIRPGGSLMAGQVRGTLDTLEIAAGAAGQVYRVVLNGLALDSATALEGDLIGGTSSFVGSGAFGDVKLDKIEMKMSMKRLHAPTYQHLMDTFSKEFYQCGPPGKAIDFTALQEKMQGYLLALLAFGPDNVARPLLRSSRAGAPASSRTPSAWRR